MTEQPRSQGFWRESPGNEVGDRSVSTKKTDMWRNLFVMRFKPI